MNYLGELKQARARTFIADNVRYDGDTGVSERVLSDAEENVLVSYISVRLVEEGGVFHQ
jgi:hypothetical protein